MLLIQEFTPIGLNGNRLQGLINQTFRSCYEKNKENNFTSEFLVISMQLCGYVVLDYKIPFYHIVT